MALPFLRWGLVFLSFDFRVWVVEAAPPETWTTSEPSFSAGGSDSKVLSGPVNPESASTHWGAALAHRGVLRWHTDEAVNPGSGSKVNSRHQALRARGAYFTCVQVSLMGSRRSGAPRLSTTQALLGERPTPSAKGLTMAESL